jgi:hypothetical protein
MSASVEMADGLQESFDRDGFVELHVRSRKVAIQVAVLGFAAVAGVAIAWSVAPALGIAAAVLAAVILSALGLLWVDQVFGAGPALRVDHDALTIRRWREPLVLAWTDVCEVFPHQPPSSRSGPLVAILMSQWVWHDYRSSRPRTLRWFDRFTHYKGRYLVLLEILDHSAEEILAFLDDDTVSRLTRLTAPYRLVLDYGEDDESPLWMRGGREAPLEQLPLTPALVQAVKTWNSELDDIAQGRTPMPEDGRLEDQGRRLAIQIQAELGPGSEVIVSQDVPKLA